MIIGILVCKFQGAFSIFSPLSFLFQPKYHREKYTKNLPTFLNKIVYFSFETYFLFHKISVKIKLYLLNGGYNVPVICYLIFIFSMPILLAGFPGSIVITPFCITSLHFSGDCCYYDALPITCFYDYIKNAPNKVHFLIFLTLS